MAEFTNVLVTDTFDQWRIKTNNIGADVTALIGTVETDLDGFRTEIGTTISDFEDDLAITLANLNTTYVTLATPQTITGAKTFQNTVNANGTLFLNYDESGVETFGVELGLNAPETDVQSIIDFHAGNTYDDYAARIFRKNTGEFQITQRGPGPLHLDTHDGANIEMYGNTAPSGTRSSIFYDATNHYFRDKNGANSGLTVNNGGITINSGKMKLNGLDYTWPSGRSGNRYLKTDVNGALSWSAVAGGTGDVNLSTLVFNDIVPVGTIMPWAGTSLPADDKWKFCNGQQISQATYPELWTVLGGTSPKYGAAGGNSLLPNLNGRVPVGTGTCIVQGPSGLANAQFNAGSVGSNGGGNLSSTSSVTLTAAQSGLPSHLHDINTSATFSTRDSPPNDEIDLITGSSRATTSSAEHNASNLVNTLGNYIANSPATDAAAAHSHTITADARAQPFLTINYIIKVLPDDVQQVSIEAGNGVNVKDALSDDSTTLDLFSTKIELLTDSAQFKFNNRRLELVTPAVSQANITSQINTAVSGLATTNYVDGVTSTGANGYMQLPGGMIMQWGTLAPSARLTDVTLPIAFPNACLNVQASIGQDMVDSNYDDNSLIWGGYPTLASPLSKVTIMSNLRASNTGVFYRKIFWTAIGH